MPALTLSDICADETGAHVFRHQVAAALHYDWPERSRAIRSCGEAAASLACVDCQRVHLVPFRCNARSCPTCAKIASALIVEKAAKRSEWATTELDVAHTWEGPGDRPRRKGWKMFTGTQQTDGVNGSDERFYPRTLRRSLKRARRGWGYFWRGLPWGKIVRTTSETTGRRTTRARRDTMFAFGLEVAPGGMVHCHAAIYGEWIEAQALRDAWETAIAWPGFIKIKAMRSADDTSFRKSLHEVLKYLTKPSPAVAGVTRELSNPLKAANIELAMRGMRRVEMGGAIRRAPRITAADLAYEGQQSCLECGAAARWHWLAIKPPAYVSANRGFGLDRWDDLNEIPTGKLRGVQYRALFNEPAPAFITGETYDNEVPF